MNDDSPDARERAEAEALAQALDGSTSAQPPEDALEIAALLRYAQGGDQASPEQLLRARERSTHAATVARLRPRHTVAVILGACAVAAAAALAFVPTLRSPGPMSARVAPAPAQAQSARAAVIEAQTQALAAPDAALDPLAAATTRYRADLLANLKQRYGGAP